MKIAIISDIHEDAVHLRCALRKIEKLKADLIICTGDIVGFNIYNHTYYRERDARECIALVKSNCKYVIPGNHDMHAAARLPGHHAGFNYPENWYELDYYQKKELAKDKLWLYEPNELNPLLTDNDIEYLNSLPEYAVIHTESDSILFSHYCTPNLSGMLRDFAHTRGDLQPHFQFMQAHSCRTAFMGHGHFPGLYIATPSEDRQYRFTRKSISLGTNLIGVPAIVRTGQSGFVLYDTNKQTVRAINL